MLTDDQPVIHAASRVALSELRPRIDAVIGRFSSVEGMSGLAGELHAITALFTGQPRLRRLLADPATPAENRTALSRTLLEGKVGASALQIVGDAVALRWSSPWDLLDAIETAGDDVLVAAAQREGVMDRVEDELFRFERILDNESSLTTLLDDASAPTDRRRTLLEHVVGGKVHPITLELLGHAVTSQRKRSIVLAIDDLIEAAAARRERSIARVATATDLSDAQVRSLSAALENVYGRPIEVRYTVDPDVRGGLVVRVGDELIDGSIASRLSQARATFAG